MADDKNDEKKPFYRRPLVWLAIGAVLVWIVTRPDAKTHDDIMAAQFWVGGPKTGGEVRTASEWDAAWQQHFGGVDDPKHRQNNGAWPAKFQPKENPFYAALPYSEFAGDWSVKPNVKKVPWYNPDKPPKRGASILKNRWLKVRLGARQVYVQWQDAGPYSDNDIDYVFGDDAPPKGKPGLLLSPAAWQYLGLRSGERVSWEFVDDASDVPAGPWSRIVTTRQMSR